MIKINRALKERNADSLKEAVNHFESAIKLDQYTPKYDEIFNYLAQILIEKIDDTDGK